MSSITGQILSDDYAQVFTGSADAVTAEWNPPSGQPTLGYPTPEQFDITTDDDYLYVAAWDKGDGAQGLLTDLRVDGIEIPSDRWQVYASLKRRDDPVALTLDDVNDALTTANSQIPLNWETPYVGNGVASYRWWDGDQNMGFGPNARWMWRSGSGLEPFEVGKSGDQGDFLVFRVALDTVGGGGGCCVDGATYVVDGGQGLYHVNLVTGKADYRGRTSTVMYDVAVDRCGQLFGIDSHSRLYLIDKTNGETNLIGEVRNDDHQYLLNALAFRRDGLLFGAGSAETGQNGAYLIDPTTGEVLQEIDLSDYPGSSGDLAFDADDNLYLTTGDGSLLRVADVNPPRVDVVGNTGIADLWGLVYQFDMLYGMDRSGQVYGIDPKDASVAKGMPLHTPADEPVGANGAAGDLWPCCCDDGQGSRAKFDFGDAPAPHPTYVREGGPYHEITCQDGRLTSPTLGFMVTAEANGQPSKDAARDRGDDGIYNASGGPLDGLDAGRMNAITVWHPHPVGGVLDVWIDFDGNGDFGGPDEHIVTSQWLNPLFPTNTISFLVPAWAKNTSNGQTYLRARISDNTQGPLTPTGFGGGGEIEDHAVAIRQGLDFGDAWESYDMDPYNGPARAGVGGPTLGLPDDPIDSEPIPNWSGGYGDDMDFSDDERGLSLSQAYLVAGSVATATLTASVPAGQTAWVSAWIDFDGDGEFEDATERILQRSVTAPPGTGMTAIPIQFQFAVPKDIVGGQFQHTFARTRISADPVLGPWLGPTGHGGLGEVEDQAVGVAQDHGDAPETYKTQKFSSAGIWNDPPRHDPGGPILGPANDFDVEADGQPTSDSRGDNINAGDDENGVTLVQWYQNKPIGTLDVELSGAPTGMLDGWIDFNQNGQFDHPDEAIFQSYPLQPGVNRLVFWNRSLPPPSDETSYYARFRVSSAGGLAPTGYARGGEIEDHLWMVCQPEGADDGQDAASGADTLLAVRADTAELNRDGVVTPLDAMLVINRLHLPGAASVFSAGETGFAAGSLRHDTDDDRLLSPADSFPAITSANRRSAADADSAANPSYALPVDANRAVESPDTAFHERLTSDILSDELVRDVLSGWTEASRLR